MFNLALCSTICGTETHLQDLFHFLGRCSTFLRHCSINCGTVPQKVGLFHFVWVFLDIDQSCLRDTKILPNLTQIIAEKHEFRYFHFVRDVNNFCFENVVLPFKIVYVKKCLHTQATRPLVYQEQSLKVSVQL